MYYDIHTHRNYVEKDVVTIFNRNVGDYASCCGLDLQHTYYSLGLHPWKIREENWSKHIDFIEKNAVFQQVKAIGECGLDTLCDTPRALQNKVLLAQVLIAEKFNKPVIIHCVKALDEIIALKKIIQPVQPWIIHGFRGKPQQAEQLIRQGFYLSFGKKLNPASLLKTPLDHLFFETDDSKDLTIEAIYLNAVKILGITLEDLLLGIEKNVNNCFFAQDKNTIIC